MGRTVEADYVVVGAGATGLAFSDALLDHAGGVRVAMVDRRTVPGGHWADAYPFVRLHQASAFYGVASTRFGDAQVQQTGPEAGLAPRATGAEVCSYFNRVLSRLVSTGRFEFLPGCSYLSDRRITAPNSDEYELPADCRVVDARYLSPTIPATTPPPFEIGDGARVIPVHELPQLADPDLPCVVVGSGKTATDACVWLLGAGVDPDRITWVRPRDPWMLNRAFVQPDPAIFLTMAASILAAAAAASDLGDLFLRMEQAGVMFRIDRRVMPTMAKTPILAQWELELLRRVERVVRLGHIRRVEPGRLFLTGGELSIEQDALVVHCAARGLQYPALMPIWSPSAITVQPIRAGFPCFGAALAGYVEATRSDDAEKNRLCPPSPLPDTLAGWARMQVLGGRAAASFGSAPDIKAWSDQVALNPAGIPADQADRPEVVAAVEQVRAHAPAGSAALAALAGTVGHP